MKYKVLNSWMSSVRQCTYAWTKQAKCLISKAQKWSYTGGVKWQYYPITLGHENCLIAVDIIFIEYKWPAAGEWCDGMWSASERTELTSPD